MAKNYANLYNRTGDSIAQNQSFYLVEETNKGEFADPQDTDFVFTQSGGAVTHTQPKQSSPHRSGRHNTDIFRQKKVTEWSLPTFINIDTSQPAAGIASVEPGIRLLWKSLLGFEDTTAGPLYNSTVDPDITFSLYECGDLWANQCRAAFVQSCTVNLPGDGEAGLEWSGRAADRLRVGIGRSSISNDGANTITLDNVTEAKRFPVGAKVMIIEGDGTTRSDDTAAGSYRTVTARDTTTGIVTLDGAVLADADGSVTPIYLAYAEPENPTGIANIQTGLVGSISIDGLGGIYSCARNVSLTLNNNHEVVDYCFGTDGLADPYFVPGSRLAIELDMTLNLNWNVLEFLDDLEDFEAQNLVFILGDSAGRHFRIDVPKAIFDVPSTTVPEEGSIPVDLSGMGFQTALEQADEITVSYP